MHEPAAPPITASRLRLHLAVLAVVLAGIFLVARPGTAFTPDEGAYGLASDALADGSWAYPNRAPGVDPDGEWPAVADSTVTEEGAYPYARHPAYALTVHGTRLLLGRGAGLVVPGLVAVVGAAAAAWAIARRTHPGGEPIAFWLVAASPLAFNGAVVWGHALAAGVAAGTTLAAVSVLRGKALAIAGVAAGAAGLVLLRSEGLLYAGAIAAALLLVAVTHRHRLAAIASSVAAVIAAAVHLAEGRWFRAITGAGSDALEIRSTEGGEATGLVSGRLTGLFRSWFDGAVHWSGAESLGIAAGATAAVAALLAVRRHGDLRGAPAALLAGASALFVLRIAAYPLDPVPGLLVAWPAASLAIVAIVRLPRRRPVPATEVLLGTTVTVFALAVLATQYADGGSLQWGGRFFALALPALGVLAAGTIARWPRRSVVLAVAALAVVPAAGGVLVLRQARQEQEALFDVIRAADAELQVTTAVHLPRLMWRDDDLVWVAPPADELDDAVEAAAAAGYDSVAVVSPAGRPVPVPSGWAADDLGVPAWGLRVTRLAPA